jgi:hypothetical protein
MVAVTIFDGLSDLNWLAVLVAALAWFVYSAIYYSIPPISKAWQRASRIPEQQGMPLPPILVMTLVLYFITSIVVGLLVAATGTHDVGPGIALGVALGVGFGVVSGLISQLYEQKGGSYWLINGFNSIVSLSIVATILAVWD